MPRFNPRDDLSMSRLHEAIEYSRERLRPFRENRKDMIDMYCGGSYGDGGESGEVLLNMMELGINIYQRQLASDTPAVSIDTQMQEYMATAHELELTLNYIMKNEIRLGETLNDVVYDALFCVGIIKVGITPREHHELEGFLHDSGLIFADVIDFYDWVHDINAGRWEQIDFCGNRYRVPFDEVMESPLFSKAGKRDLYATFKTDSGRLFENREQESPETLTQGLSPMPSEYRRHVELWDMWLPSENLIVTLPGSLYGKPLRVVEWEGPERGPYHLLGFSKVPGNIIPLAPAMVWEDINDLINRLIAKAARQADRQKTVLAGQNRTKSAMEAILDTPDGMSLVSDIDPNLIKEFVFGGVDGNLMSALTAFKDMFSYQAGNLDMLGGLGPQSSTVGQDRLLSQGASQRLNDMQDRVVKFTQGIVEDLAWYLWNDPLANIPLTKKVTENIEIPFNWTAESKKGDLFYYNFNVQPHSLQAKSPQEKLQTMLQIVNTVILPMMPFLQQQGISFDAEKFLEIVAKLSNSHEIEKILIKDTGEPIGQQQKEARQSPVTQRTNLRMDRGADGREAQQPTFEGNRGPYKQQTLANVG